MSRSPRTLAGAGAESTSAGPRPDHVPQVHVRFPAREKWSAHGRFERFALWPEAGKATTFRGRHWTAYYRQRPEADATTVRASDRPACCQLFVCRGAIELDSPRGSRTLAAGDFACGMHSEAALEGARSSDDLLMVVKYQADNLATIDYKVGRKARLRYLPYFYGHGKVDDFRSALLHGNPLGSPTNLAAIVRFPEGTIVSSHYHDEPIFHEFVYLQGGHMTPDGFYAPGDHVTSIPGCKEGPWLAALEPSRGRIPSSWPTYASSREMVRHTEPPWSPPFDGKAEADVHGLLFVHGGPFVKLTAGINWHVLEDDELGPRG